MSMLIVFVQILTVYVLDHTKQRQYCFILCPNKELYSLSQKLPKEDNSRDEPEVEIQAQEHAYSFFVKIKV